MGLHAVLFVQKIPTQAKGGLEWASRPLFYHVDSHYCFEPGLPRLLAPSRYPNAVPENR
jgi:hypothetical protein